MESKWEPDTEFEAKLDLDYQIMEGNLEDSRCFLQGETDAQCAARWRRKAYSIVTYAKELSETCDNIGKQIRYMNIQSIEYENKSGISTEEIKQKKRTFKDICETQLGVTDVNGNYSFKNENFVYSIRMFDCSWVGEVKKDRSTISEWLTDGRYADVFAKDQVLHFIYHFKNKYHAKEPPPATRKDLSFFLD